MWWRQLFLCFVGKLFAVVKDTKPEKPVHCLADNCCKEMASYDLKYLTRTSRRDYLTINKRDKIKEKTVY